MLDAFIPDKLSVWLHVTVIVFVVLDTVGLVVVGNSLSTFITYSWLYVVLFPSVVVTFNVVVPFVLTVVSTVVPALTSCAEFDVLEYVDVPVLLWTNFTYTFLFDHCPDVYAEPVAVSFVSVNVPAFSSVVVIDNSFDSCVFPALSVAFVFIVYVWFIFNPVNVFDVCHADQLFPSFIAYCMLELFIPDKLSVCLNVAVMLLVVAVAIGATSVGAVLSIFTV